MDKRKNISPQKRRQLNRSKYVKEGVKFSKEQQQMLLEELSKSKESLRKSKEEFARIQGDNPQEVQSPEKPMGDAQLMKVLKQRLGRSEPKQTGVHIMQNNDLNQQLPLNVTLFAGQSQIRIQDGNPSNGPIVQNLDQINQFNIDQIPMQPSDFEIYKQYKLKQNESSIIDKYLEKTKKAGSVTPISLGRGSALSNIQVVAHQYHPQNPQKYPQMNHMGIGLSDILDLQTNSNSPNQITYQNSPQNQELIERTMSGDNYQLTQELINQGLVQQSSGHNSIDGIKGDDGSSGYQNASKFNEYQVHSNMQSNGFEIGMPRRSNPRNNKKILFSQMQTGMPGGRKTEENLEHKKFLNSSKGLGGYKGLSPAGSKNLSPNRSPQAGRINYQLTQQDKFQTIPELDGTFDPTISSMRKDNNNQLGFQKGKASASPVASPMNASEVVSNIHQQAIYNEVSEAAITQINLKSGASSIHPQAKNQQEQYDQSYQNEPMLRGNDEFKAGESLRSNNGRDTILGEARNTARLSNKSALSKGTHIHPNEMMIQEGNRSGFKNDKPEMVDKAQSNRVSPRGSENNLGLKPDEMIPQASNIGMYGTVVQDANFLSQKKLRFPKGSIIQASGKKQSPYPRREESMGRSMQRKDNFGISMQNVSPIEVYIENRSTRNHQQTQQGSKFKFPKINLGPNQKPNIQITTQRTHGEGFHGLSPNLRNRSSLPKDVPQSGIIKGGYSFGLSPGGKNPNNPYMSQYVDGKKKPPDFANIASLPIQTIDGPVVANIDHSQRNVSAMEKNSKITNKSNMGVHKSPSKMSKVNMAPIYKGQPQQINPKEIINTDIEIGGADIFQEAVYGPVKRKNDHFEADYMKNELQDLQEQTAEDAEDLADELMRRTKGKKTQGQNFLNDTQKLSLSTNYKMMNDTIKDSKDLDKQNLAISVMTDYKHEPIAPRVDAFNSKEVEKVFRYYSEQKQLGGNTELILSEIANLKNKVFITSPSKQTLAEEDGVPSYETYKNQKKSRDQNLYLNDEAIKNKRNYEELYYKQRHHEKKSEYLELLKLKMAKPKGHSSDNLLPQYMEENQLASHKINKTISEIEYIKKQFHSPSPLKKNTKFSQLEVILEKQKIGLSTQDQQQALKLENMLEEESNAKNDIDQQIQNRFQELMEKGLYFTSNKKKKQRPGQKDTSLNVHQYLDDDFFGLGKNDDGAELARGWEVGEGWETDPALAPASPAMVGVEAMKKKMLRTRRIDQVGELSEISDRWKAIAQDPAITKDDVMPQNDEVLQMIKDRYMGRDDEYHRRLQFKDQLLQKDTLQEIYSQNKNYKFGESPVGKPSKEQKQYESQLGYLDGSMMADIDRAGSNPFDLPRNKVLSKNYSKVSLSPSNIMPGGGLKELDVEMRHMIKNTDAGSLVRNSSQATIQPTGLNRNLSQNTIATLKSVQDHETVRKKTINRQQILSELQKLNQIELAKKKENSTRNETYSRVLNHSNLVLPSLFKDNVAVLALPEHEMLSTKTRLGGRCPNEVNIQAYSVRNQTLNQSSLRRLNEANSVRYSNGRNSMKRQFKTVNTSRNLDGLDVDQFDNGSASGAVKKYDKEDKLPGIQPPDNQQALYYRKELSYLDKHGPKLRNSDIEAKSEWLPKYSQTELQQGFKKAIIVKPSLRMPKFKLTEYAQYLKDTGDDKLMADLSSKASAETGRKLREMLESVM